MSALTIAIATEIAIRPVFGIVFAVFSIVVGELIHKQGKRLLSHALGPSPATTAITTLMRTGWYMLMIGILLWNLGIEESIHSRQSALTQISLRLGVSVFAIACIHGLNVLALSLFHRKNQKDTQS